MKRTSFLAALSVPVGLMSFAAPTQAATTVFNDNFNRADANNLGANWTAIHNSGGGQLGVVGNKAANLNGVNNTMYVLSGLTAAYTHTTLRVDVSSGVGGQSLALNLGMNPSDSTGGLFLQARTDGTGMFTIVEMDTGTNMTDSTRWTTPTSTFSPTPFATAWITGRALDVDTIYLGIDADKNGVDEQSFTRNLNLANMGFGNRMGMTLTGTAGRADDFVATVIDPADVTWNVAGGGTWDSVTSNWTGGSLHPNRYFNTDHAIFNKTNGGSITLAGGANAAAIAPGSTTVNASHADGTVASSGTYTFAGSGIVSGTLTKTGLNRLVLTNPNTFTGDTTVHNAGSIGVNGSTAHLTLANPAGNSLAGDLHIGDATSSGVAKVSLAHPNQIADNRVIYFDSPSGRFGYFSMRGNSETVAGIHSGTATGGVVENGNLSGAINTNATLTLAPPAATTYSYGGFLRDADSGGGTGKLNIVINGPGTQELKAGNYSYTGTTTVNAGTLQLATSLTTSSSLTIANGATARLTAGHDKVLATNSVTASGTGKLDLTDNSAVLRNTTLAAVKTLITTGFNGGNWLGAGITSSSAAANNLTAIGFADNAVLARTTFAGVTGLDSNDVLVKYTYYGDADLSGITTLDDFTLFLNGYQTAGTTWVQGDFDYSGLVTLDDFTLFLAGYQNQGAPLSAIEAMIDATPMSAAERSAMLAAVQAVPEPATASAVALAAMLGLSAARRRRRPPQH
jgi:autotransporter-associated beta strand protein